MTFPHRITLKDIAKRVGVSHVTVSLALKNSPRVSLKKREEIQLLTKELGYCPDPMLSSLVAYRQSKRLHPIQSAIAWINHWDMPHGLRKSHDFDLYWQGALNAATRLGYNLEEFVWKHDMTAQRMQTILQTRQIRGVLIPPHPYQPDWGEFQWKNFTIIRFGLSILNPVSHIVTSDQMQGVCLATKTIHQYGYKRVGFIISDYFDRRIGCNHVAGFQAAQRLMGMQHQLPPLLLSSDKDEVLRQLTEWLSLHQPDAVLTTEDYIPGMLRQLGIRIPEDLAAASTSVSDISEVDAGLDQNSEEIGRIALEYLISLINANDVAHPFVARRLLVASDWRDGITLPRKNIISDEGLASSILHL